MERGGRAASEFVALSVLIWSIFSGAGAAPSQSQADRIFGPCSYKRRSGGLSLCADAFLARGGNACE